MSVDVDWAGFFEGIMAFAVKKRTSEMRSLAKAAEPANIPGKTRATSERKKRGEAVTC